MITVHCDLCGKAIDERAAFRMTLEYQTEPNIHALVYAKQSYELCKDCSRTMKLLIDKIIAEEEKA